MLVVNGAWAGAGETLFAEMCARGWEGVVAKRAAAPYVSRRSQDWLKIKCVRRQEFVVGGFTEPQGQRVGLGALLVGVYEGDRLRYAGKVGTGFSQRVLTQLRARLEAIEVPVSPFGTDRFPNVRRTGSARSWWPRCASPSGRPTGGCATPPSRAYATTRIRPRWCGSDGH